MIKIVNIVGIVGISTGLWYFISYNHAVVTTPFSPDNSHGFIIPYELKGRIHYLDEKSLKHIKLSFLIFATSWVFALGLAVASHYSKDEE